MLKKILGPKGKKVRGYSIKLQNKEVYSSPNNVRVIKWKQFDECDM
jgi:hypothetical protein